jgi:hypothetical protein
VSCALAPALDQLTLDLTEDIGSKVVARRGTRALAGL